MISTANGLSVLEGTLNLPRAGVWHADLMVDTTTATSLTGAIALSLFDAQLTLAGTSYRAPQTWRGVTRVRMAAGAAGLRTLMSAQSYASAPASLIVGDILTAAGEALSATSMSLAQRMAWTRFGVDVSAGTALQAVVDELGAVWRSLPDGTVWIGQESWPAWSVTDFDVTDLQPEDGRLELVTDTPTLLPGMALTGPTFTGGNVGRVTYRIASDAVRVEAFFES